MAIIRWRPYREMISLRDSIDRLFNEYTISDWSESGSELPVAIDMYETDDHLVVSSSLPGVKADDIEIDVNDSRMTIKGEFKVEEEQEKGDVHYQERRYGRFCRSVVLPPNIDRDEIETAFDDGILMDRLPKPEESKTKRIEVKKARYYGFR